MKKAIAYTRLNHSDGTVEYPEPSLRAQKSRLKRYAKKIGVEIVTHFEDQNDVDNDSVQTTFMNLLEYIVKHSNNIDMLLLHYEDILTYDSSEKAFILRSLLSQLNIALWWDNCEPLTLTDDVLEIILYNQREDINLVREIGLCSKSIYKSEQTYGRVIALNFPDIADQQMQFDFADYATYKGIHITQIYNIEEYNFPAFELIETIINGIGVLDGFTLITNSLFFNNRSDDSVTMLHRLFALGLKKLHIPVFAWNGIYFMIEVGCQDGIIHYEFV